MSNRDVAQQIGDLIHGSFHNARVGVKNMTAITGATQASGDVRKELMTCAAQLKRNDIDVEVLTKVEANIRTANVMGLVTDETHDKIIDLLNKVVEREHGR